MSDPASYRLPHQRRILLNGVVPENDHGRLEESARYSKNARSSKPRFDRLLGAHDHSNRHACCVVERAEWENEEPYNCTFNQSNRSCPETELTSMPVDDSAVRSKSHIRLRDPGWASGRAMV